jgi:DNA-directed RNA polymerase specialized sigma24 family protein
MAFLARISSSVVQDYQRELRTRKRSGHVVPIDFADDLGVSGTEEQNLRFTTLNAILAWIDIERLVGSDPDQKNARRNALIFKLHYVDGFECEEIARFPGFGLTTSGIETVLARLRKKIQNEK